MHITLNILCQERVNQIITFPFYLVHLFICFLFPEYSNCGYNFSVCNNFPFDQKSYKRIGNTFIFRLIHQEIVEKITFNNYQE